MGATLDEIRNLVQGELIRIRNSNGAVFEADCSAILGRGLPEFPEERLARVLESEKAVELEPRTLVAVDFKTIMPCLSKMENNDGCYYYQINCSREQKESCAAFIVCSPASPHLVAVIPLYYLEKSGRGLVGKAEPTAFISRKIPFFGETIEPYPLEWTPFVMPVDFVDKSLDLLGQFASGKITSWKNPYNGIVFSKCPKPTLSDTRILLPPANSALTDYSFLEHLRRAFLAHGGDYRVDTPRIRASGGDLVVTHIPSRARAMLEVKRRLLRFLDDETIVHEAYRVNRQDRGCIFTPFTAWDLFLSTANSGDRAVLLSRDDLPLDWFHERPDSTTRTGKFTEEFLKRHTVRGIKAAGQRPADTHAQEGLVDQMVVLFDRFREEGKFCARTTTDALKTLPNKDDKGLGDASLLTDGRKPEVQITLPSRSGREGDQEGPGRTRVLFKRRMYPSQQAAMLNRVCAENGNYAVHELGLHPSATHVFALGRANSIVELHPDTPMIYLNFAQVDMLQFRPHDKRRPSALFAATHGESKSIYILNPVPNDLDERPHNYFVLPSEALATERRRKVNDGQLNPRQRDAKKRPARRATPITLRHREPLLVYRVARSGLEASLLRIFQQRLN
ncbi:hypothetical protein A1O7_02883 [Cladophialophora yegresii CBS 114405]|uniref:Uncharacterized protein n=1 Tax=Cladophialophora yegresii CBS 114405 TaxID=1182544 RepID=W9W3D1_9EURO|nr:uncharacterized protein A1O7_02883 [Cladophialophora yegresii CBS 114405]EXJ62448.1 hypothetical protein A1O7_02883 [Cladophialophora yegresii CBS 114405]